MGKFLILILFLFSASLVFVSCEEATCTDSTAVNINISFYKQTSNTASAFDSLTVRGLNRTKDSLLYNRAKSIKKIALPLHILVDSTGFEIDFFQSNSASTLQKYTVWFFHKNRPFYISPECGCSVFATIDTIKMTHHRISQIRITKPEITNLNEEHVIILY